MEKQKTFGQRGMPSTVSRAPPSETVGAGRKRSLAVNLVVMGALALAAYETLDWIERKINCEPDPAKPEELVCKHRNGSSYRRSLGRSWRWSSRESAASPSAAGADFGGFGKSGHAFSGGG